MTNETSNIHDDSNNDNSLIEQLRRDLQTPGPWEKRWRNLVRGIAESQSDSALTCDECQRLLDAYIGEELQGREASRSYPAVARHLETCDACGQDYEATIDALLQAPSDTPLQAPRRVLAFLESRRNTANWVSRIRSRLAGDAFGLQIVLNPEYVRARLGLAPTLPTANVFRSDDTQSASKPRTLLVDDVDFDGQRLNVKVRALPQDNARRLALEAQLISDAALPDNLWLQLNWAGQLYTARVQRTQPVEGFARIDGVALPHTLEAAGAADARFEIVFEVRDLQADDDTPSDE
jgi:hypothetical protein